MSYIEGSLGTNERLIARAHFHWLYHAAAWAALVACLALAAWLLSGGYSGIWSALAVLLGIAAFLAILVPIWTTEIGVTNQRLIMKQGVLGRHTHEVLLTAVEQVNLIQGALGRILDFGRINVHGTGDDLVAIPAIAAPMHFRQAIQDALAQARGRRAG